MAGKANQQDVGQATLQSAKGTTESGHECVDLDASDLRLPGQTMVPTLISKRPARGDTILEQGAVKSQAEPQASESVGLEFAERYAFRKVLGEGGMGEVRLCRDHAIGREVAMKVAREASPELQPDMQARFVREVRVQGQLEHPSIVPVYDLGVDANGALYFTMKRVRGKSLADVLDALRAGDLEAVRHYSLRKLLSTLSSLCLVLDFAHSRGVLHRDVKPANVMLGDFGEVYLLDWGLAKVLGAREAESREVVSDAPRSAANTLAGQVMGTPGYMSPEQFAADHGELDARSDVYSLGVVLFELLTLQPMHPTSSFKALMTSTLSTEPRTPSSAAPGADVPPELDAICLKATALKPAERFASARALSDAIESFLDGDRDLELRRQMSGRHAARARTALLRAKGGAPNEAEERGFAMREVTTALGLDPQNPDALGTLIALLTEPPRDVPAEASEEMRKSEVQSQVRSARAAFWVYLAFALYLPFPFWLGLKSWPALGALVVVVAACAGLMLYHSLRPPPEPRVPFVTVAFSTFAVIASASMLGPFIIVPVLAMANSMGYISSCPKKNRFVIQIASALGVLIPAVLQWTGVWPASYAFKDGTMQVLPQMFALPAVPTFVFLLITSVALAFAASLYVARIRDSALDAERKLHLQAWQLRQIIPRQARDLV
jgi:eukaryotic-like serine/threonine-protein kinase